MILVCMLGLSWQVIPEAYALLAPEKCSLISASSISFRETTLITFIGKGEAATNASADPYQRTTYQFTDGRSMTSTFFGEVLSQHQRPTVIHVFGTRTSSWRALAWDSVQDIELATRLEAVEKTGVTDDLVTELARFQRHGGARLLSGKDPQMKESCDRLRFARIRTSFPAPGD